jgi:hypothetical protein
MKVFHLFPKESIEGENPWEPWYDKAFGFVIRAENEQEARKIANENGGDEVGEVSNNVYRTGGDPWLNPNFSECITLSCDGKKGVIIKDLRSA